MNILILHGWMQNKESWNSLKTQLTNTDGIKKIVAVDLPGFGKEPVVSNSWGVPEYALWVEDLIKKEKLDNLVILGHSFGGRITSLIASKRPKYLRAIILSGSPSIYRPSLQTRTKNKVFKHLKGAALLKRFEGRFYSKELLDAHSKGMDIVFKKVIPFDQTEAIKKITVPTLIIWGEKDSSVPLTVGEEIHSLIKDSTFEVIKGGSHNSFISHPYLFLGHVKNFLKSV